MKQATRVLCRSRGQTASGLQKGLDAAAVAKSAQKLLVEFSRSVASKCCQSSGIPARAPVSHHQHRKSCRPRAVSRRPTRRATEAEASQTHITHSCDTNNSQDGGASGPVSQLATSRPLGSTNALCTGAPADPATQLQPTATHRHDALARLDPQSQGARHQLCPSTVRLVFHRRSVQGLQR